MKILFFSPFSGIWINKSREAVLAKALMDYGVDIEYIFCDGIYNPFCITMLSLGLKEQSSNVKKLKVCQQCKIKRKEIINKLNCKFSLLEDFYTNANSKEINVLLSKINKNNYLDFNIDNIEVGRTALYEFLIARKKRSYEMSDIEWDDYLGHLRNNLITHFAISSFLKKNKNFDAVFLQNGLYSVNRQVHYLAKVNNIKTYIYDNVSNLSNQMGGFVFAKGSPFIFYSELYEKYWPLVKERSLSTKQIISVTKHINILLSSNNHYAFSSARTGKFCTREYFGIEKDKKIVLVSTSSYDEQFSAYSNKSRPTHAELGIIFTSLEDWLSSLILWVKGHSHIVLIIRIHPREAKIIAKTGESENLNLLRELLINLPINVKINWPEQNISLYDMFDDIDLVLNAWSSVGFESTLFQIPVLLYSEKITLYPSELNVVASTSKEDYLNAIENNLNNFLTFKDTILVYRWYSLLFEGSTIAIKKSMISYLIDFLINPKISGRYPVRRIMLLLKVYNYRTGNISDYKIKIEQIEKIVKLIANNGKTLMDVDYLKYNINNCKINEEKKIRKYLKKFGIKKKTINY
jgi:hypothetical protein